MSITLSGGSWEQTIAILLEATEPVNGSWLQAIANALANLPTGSTTPAGIVYFNVNPDPNTSGTTFDPDIQLTTNTLYVSNINSSTWISDGLAYQTYTGTTVDRTEWTLAGTQIDAGSNKTDSISRTGNTYIGYSTGLTSDVKFGVVTTGGTMVFRVYENGGIAEGQNTTASGLYSHAEGYSSLASGEDSHAEGGVESDGLSGGTAEGSGSHAEGGATTASGYVSHAEGYGTISSNVGSHAEGNSSVASGFASHAEGYFTTANGTQSHAEGSSTTAVGAFTHSEGSNTIASGSYSHSEGDTTFAFGNASHAEGSSTTASGSFSHAEGSSTTASGQGSHSEGNATTASGLNSHAGGKSSKASGINSFVHGSGSTASGSGTIVLGNGITGATANTTFVKKLNIVSAPGYADDAEAAGAGLTIGMVFQTTGVGAPPLDVAGILMIKQ